MAQLLNDHGFGNFVGAENTQSSEDQTNGVKF